MAQAQEPIPIIISGWSPEAARVMKKTLEPEFETVYAILDTSQGGLWNDIVEIGEGRLPANTQGNIGTLNMTAERRPAALVSTGGPKMTELPRLRALARMPTLDSDYPIFGEVEPAIVQAVADAAKKELIKLRDEGKLTDEKAPEAIKYKTGYIF